MLYKYVGPERMDVLKNRCIRYSQPDAFNDPFEIKPFISKLASEEALPGAVQQKFASIPAQLRNTISFEEFNRVSKQFVEDNMSHVDELFAIITQTMRLQLSDTLAKVVGILSLTETPDNLLMWAHYASSHEGFVIGFDENHSYFNERRGPNDEFHYLRKVEYRKQRPNAPMIELTGTELFLVKSEQWSYENEWRILRPLHDANQTVNAGPLPIHLFSFPTEIIREIILGCRMSENIKNQLIQMVHSDELYRDVKILHAKPDEKEFRLIIEA